ncbi:MAG: glutaredoxin domain-containing protein [Bacteroidales bacterium]|nr:glutaredoxin domain-containing protein [Bacteroidales bacterium]
MEAIAVHSYKELVSGLSGEERAFLLIYKSGAGQSDCALERIEKMSRNDSQKLFTADVNSVRDIHEKLEITTAPSLVIFEKGKKVNVVKGCQTEAAYSSILSGREIGGQKGGEAGKSKQVTVYTTPSCSWCTTLKTYLDQKQVRYREINVAADSTAAEAMVRKSGQQGVPQTEINGQMIVGFDRTRINQLLEIK